MVSEPDVEHPEPCDAKDDANTWRVLILDTPKHTEMLKECCKECGYDVVGATTIDEAWMFLRGKDHVDVIVCAAHLENESMFSFLLGVRSSDNPLHKNAAFIILSLAPGKMGSHPDKSAAATGLALGANAFVQMPVFDAEELDRHIRRLKPSVPILQQTKAGRDK